MVRHGIEIPEDKIAEFCRRHGIRKLSLFGSILGEEFGSDSDVDVLVEFDESATVGYFGFIGMELELADMLNHSVRLCTPNVACTRLRERMAREAEPVYAA